MSLLEMLYLYSGHCFDENIYYQCRVDAFFRTRSNISRLGKFVG